MPVPFVYIDQDYLFVYLFIYVYAFSVTIMSDDIPINASLITEYPIGLNVAIRWTFILPDLEVRIEMFIRIPAILNLNIRGVHQYLHTNDKIVPKITAQPLPSTYFPSRYSPITVSFSCIYSDLTMYWKKPRVTRFPFTTLKTSYKFYVQHND